MSSSLGRSALLAGILVIAAGCSPVWRTGMRSVQSGRYYGACEYWLEVLDETPEDPSARRGLKKYGVDALRVQHDIAREHEAEQRYEAAIETYGKLIDFVAVLDEQELRTFDLTVDLQDELTDVEQQFTAYRYEQGLRAAARLDWLSAIEWWERARELRPNYEDTTQRMAEGYRAQAEKDLAADKYEEASRHYLAAWEFDGSEESLMWGAAVKWALGKYYLKKGGCRQAVFALELAAENLPDTKIKEALADAEECAKVELVVHTLDQTTVESVGGTDMGTLISDRVAESLRSRGSRFVRLLDPESAPAMAIGAEHGVRYDVKGRISQLQVDTPEPLETQQTVTGRRRELCPGPAGYYSSNDEWCDEDVTVTYTEHKESVGMRIGASVRVVAPDSGEQILARSLETTASHEVLQVRDFRMRVGSELEPAPVGEKPGDGMVAIDTELLALRADPPALPTTTDSFAEAAGQLSDLAADAILEKVDLALPVDPPQALIIRPPVVTPDDLMLVPGEITTEPKHTPEPEPGPEPAPEEAPDDEPAPREEQKD